MSKSGFVHEVEGGENLTDHWLTPRSLVDSMGSFDLDPCAYRNSATHIAQHNYCLPESDGLLMPWNGAVFCNPPYGDQIGKWIERCALHNNAVLLVFARTETLGFRPNWKFATAMLYFYKRIAFVNPITMQAVKGGGAHLLWRLLSGPPLSKNYVV